MDINTGIGKREMVKVYCTNSDKTVDAELIKTEKDRITVILPGFQKLILNRSTKPGMYIANQFGMEFIVRTL
jgi:hypothetical protein